MVAFDLTEPATLTCWDLRAFLGHVGCTYTYAYCFLARRHRWRWTSLLEAGDVRTLFSVAEAFSYMYGAY
jgi:hypothetical protein